MRRLDRHTLAHAAAGVLAGAVGMSVAHLTAALLTPASSPALAVSTAVIDATPTPVKEWAVRELGTADKPILIGSVLLVTIGFAAVIGVVARRRLRLGVGLMAGLVLLAGAAVVRQPLFKITDLVPTVVALVLGPGLLVLLTRALTAERTPRDRQDAPSEGAATRRSVLIGFGALALLSAAAATGGQLIVRGRTALADIMLPRVRDPLPALPAGLEETHQGISRFITRNRDFYRVDTKLAVPIVDQNSWSLTIDGDVERELTFSYDDLRERGNVEHDITLTCVSNEVGGKLVGAARWTGVPLRALLEEAGVGKNADQILSTDVEGFTISTPLEAAMDGRNAIIALGMNGEVLPRAHGFPARLVVPGLYGYVGATKWVTRLTLTRYDEATAYWTDRDWAIDAPIKLSSRIDTPRPLSNIPSGRTVIGGVAWAQHHGVATVDVRIDGGRWQPAELGPDAGIDYWRQWFLPWDAQPGSHQLAVRVVDRDGNVQSAERATPFPDGSSGIQEIVVTVTE
ncbi:DMSO/TMAO reductase YedYZ, molybdopterin-dependent catalytic subunit [Nocardioides sp. YR527]|uniref:molybdopterin-dependent oxidoreductase n=1 Tax=Nocardioides sp. YR527 TaxID=1881028 RepID=UPI000882E1B4|nr:molybdopterin-dependent oxidoreductase [Nocardioides sp. YR527]SDL09031.1 DMSO/TMAO reductase YedYZ, molybdopterin-dependent catalytic subunit [Nocardioides sp. YR527]